MWCLLNACLFQPISWAFSLTAFILMWMLEHWMVTAVVCLVVTKLNWMVNTGICLETTRMEGKTVIVTGASSGLGKETARDLAKRGARVIMGCINLDKAKRARDEIIRSSGNDNVVLKHLDVSSLASVRRFAEEIQRTEPRLDVLINNAGVMGMPERQLTEDGLELQMATNYFGPFLLTNLLLDLLKKSAPSRIINVTSCVHWLVDADLENLNSEKYYNRWKIYATSKLLLVYMAKQLTGRLKGTGVTCNSARPSGVHTDLIRYLNPYLRAVLIVAMATYVKTAEEGAQSIIYAAVSENLENVSGKLFAECKVEDEAKHVQDTVVAARAWDMAAELTGLKSPGALVNGCDNTGEESSQ